jgi:hypothetical protein
LPLMFLVAYLQARSLIKLIFLKFLVANFYKIDDIKLIIPLKTPQI